MGSTALKIDGLDEPTEVGSRRDLDDSSQELLHVLAVDDSLVDRKVIERLLKISSCKVTAVDSGTRALQYLGLDGEKNSTVGFNDLKVNLIITDYWMPGMTGYELLKKIKGSTAFREIPVVIMSSENVLPRINRCLEEGAEDFIVKPVKLSDVKRLKDYIMKEELVTTEESRVSKGTLKRKLEVSEEEDRVISSTTTSSSSSSPSSPSSPSSSSLSPCSSPMNSPSRRHKTTEESSTDEPMLCRYSSC